MELKNKGAKENGWEDVGAYWRSWYEVDDLEITVEGFRTDLKPESAEFPKFAANKESPPHTFQLSNTPHRLSFSG